MSRPVRQEPTVAEMTEGLLKGDRMLLARAMTWAESTRSEDVARFRECLTKVSSSGKSALKSARRIGISGTPGVGKSTFIEALGMTMMAAGREVAVLAIDPSSSASGGSILGDKTRMEELSRHEKAFVRPSASRGFLGGTHARTFDLIELCEAVGFDDVIVETVGVGQSEIAIRDLVDMVVLLIQPASGDELQGIKRGIVEIADWILVNKADGSNRAAAEVSRLEYESAARLFDRKIAVEKISGLDRAQVSAFWSRASSWLEEQRTSGAWLSRREAQREAWFRSHLDLRLRERVLADPFRKKELVASISKLSLSPEGRLDLSQGHQSVEALLDSWLVP